MSEVILVSGASGYAGSHIASALIQSGFNAHSVGRNTSDSVFFDLMKSTNFVKSSIPEGATTLVHAAGAHEVICSREPLMAYTANVTGTRALVESAIDAGVRKIIYVSTFHVFGMPKGRIDESCRPEPENDYGLSHLMAEEVVKMLARQSKISFHILRPTNLFGVPYDWSKFKRWTLAPFDFVNQALDSNQIVLRSDGSPMRSYVSVERLAEAVLAATKENFPEVTHVSGASWTMQELSNLVAQLSSEILKRKIDVSFGKSNVPNASFEFLSNHWPQEEDAVSKMKAFLNESLAYKMRRCKK